MTLLLFILLVVLVATFGLWETLVAMVGAAFLMVLVVLLGISAVGVAGFIFVKRRAGG